LLNSPEINPVEEIVKNGSKITYRVVGKKYVHQHTIVDELENRYKNSQEENKNIDVMAEITKEIKLGGQILPDLLTTEKAFKEAID